MAQYNFDHDRELFLLIGHITHEGIVSLLETSGKQYKNKLLKSSPQNWWSIVEYYNDFKIAASILKLTTKSLMRIISPRYENVREELFKKIASTNNLVFIYEDFLTGEIENEGWHTLNYPSQENYDEAINFLDGYDLNIMSYEHNSEMTILASNFIKENDSNLILRFYVPLNRMWANEIDRILKLFKDYLSRVGDFTVRLEQESTNKGNIYKFFVEEEVPDIDFGIEFSEFSNFIKLCAFDTDAARELLKNTSLNTDDIESLLTRYSKEARRIQIDLKQERESRLLNIRHQLESELTDLESGAIELSKINSIVESLIPKVDDAMNLLPSQSTVPLQVINSSDVKININSQIIEKVEGVVGKEIYGDQHLSNNGEKLIRLIQEYGGSNKNELITSVHEFEDEAVDKSKKFTAKRMLKSFLLRAKDEAIGIGSGIVQSLLEDYLI